MRPLERAARAIVDSLPTTMAAGDGMAAVDVALLIDLRLALAYEVWQGPMAHAESGRERTRRALGGEDE